MIELETISQKIEYQYVTVCAPHKRTMSVSLRHLPVVISRYTECGHATMSRRVIHREGQPRSQGLFPKPENRPWEGGCVQEFTGLGNSGSEQESIAAVNLSVAKFIHLTNILQ